MASKSPAQFICSYAATSTLSQDRRPGHHPDWMMVRPRPGAYKGSMICHT
jgi:hypothetical protein